MRCTHTARGLSAQKENDFPVKRIAAILLVGFVLVTINDPAQVGEINTNRWKWDFEAFHHIAEAFATRLEVIYRFPTYSEGFERLSSGIRQR
jgi:hypothetical protein